MKTLTTQHVSPMQSIADIMAANPKEPLDLFDGPWYLSQNEDVHKSGMDPRKHYVIHGWKGGRDPAPWFSVKWYNTLVFNNAHQDEIEPLTHFVTIGRAAGFSPNEAAEEDLLQRAHLLFDPDFYNRKNPDVVAAKVDPWRHFLRHGWKEFRRPYRSFDPFYYTRTHLDPDSEPRNALLHYALIGQAQGLSTIPSRDTRDDRATLSSSLQALLAWNAAHNPHQERTDAELLQNSFLFDPVYYARVCGIEGSRTELIADFLSRSHATCPNPSAGFSCAFYVSAYEDFIPEGQNPLVHYLREGHQNGFYPAPSLVHEDAVRLEAEPSLSQDLYHHTRVHTLEYSIIHDYLLKGQHLGASLHHDANDGFIKALYGPLIGDIGAPLAFFMRHKAKAWMVASPEHLEAVAAQVRTSAFFDAQYYAGAAAIAGTEIDPAEHYILIGLRHRISCHRDFDTDFYLTTYPDISGVPVVPVVHFSDHGRDEGRLGCQETATFRKPGAQAYETQRETILVFSHEASRTGAPIVALNVARILAKTHNVVCWVGQSGALFDDFAECAVEIVEGWSGTDANVSCLGQIIEAYGCDRAIVNSVVCHPILPALRLQGIPVVSLIHEFANYVYPLGTTSRMALSSDITVVPADIVGDAMVREMHKLGTDARCDNLRVRPQGYNSGSARAAPITAQDVLDFIGVSKDNTRTRILFGAGYVQPRKGLDLFLQTARYLFDDPDHDWRFIWVGGNYHPDKDMVTSVYIEHQIISAGLEQHFTFFDEQPSLDPFWEVADVFLMSSRLDPYPNVALDALARDVPLVCFRGATGIAALEEPYPWAVRAVTFADVAAAADVCRGFAADIADIREIFQGETGKAMLEALSFENYVSDLLGFVEEAREKQEQVRDIERRLEPLDNIDLFRAARFIPEVLTFSAPLRPDLLRRVLAEFLLAGRLQTGLMFSKDTGLCPLPLWEQAQGGAGSILPWNPDHGNACLRTRLQTPDHLIYLHVTHADALTLLQASNINVARLFANAQMVIVTASSPSIISALHDAEFADATIEPDPVLSPIWHLRGLCAQTDARYVSFCELGLSASQQISKSLRGLEIEVLSMLETGVSDEALQEDDLGAVLACAQLGDRNAAAEAANAVAAPVYAPRFAGSYERTVLKRFFAEREEQLTTALAGSDSNAMLSIAAIEFMKFLLNEQDLTCAFLPVRGVT